MKTFRLLLACSVLAFTVTTPAQQYLSLGQKRTNLVSNLRNLGPLEPTSWLATLPVVAPNYGYAYGNYTYFYVGNYGYVNLGPDPLHPGDYIYDYSYRSSGAWVASDDVYLNNTDAMFKFDFGISLPYVPNGQSVNYSFTLPSAWYSIAGLRYESVFVVSGLSGGNPTGWIVNRGQTVNTSVAFDTARTFDLGQNLEMPSFKITDYWFGPFWNYPQTAKAPQPQNTMRQSQNTLFVGATSKPSTNVAWVEEGVYRPGFALPPGYSSPLVYTYMQQYFDSAWKADPVTGSPPRSSATNWNGIGKINTNSALRTGLVQGLGYYYTPTEYGKAILTTQPQENGFYGELPFYALQLLVDKNRDGALDTNDTTSASTPHVFWANNDCDRATYSDANLWDELDFEVGEENVSDADFVRANFRIPTLRDLEDYDRLHINGLYELCRDLPTGQGYTVSLRWKTILSGSPGIFVFKAVDAYGSRGYLTNQTLAAAQMSPSVYPPTGSPGLSPLTIGRVESGIDAVLHNDSFRGTNDFYIYCGTGRGSGELAVSVYKSSQLIGEASVFLDLRDVKELYERWTLGDGNETEPTATPSLVSDGLPPSTPATYFNDSTASGRNYILFVHGWNMAPWEKDSFSETAFKRLYWQGYTNRFGSLRWPTGYGFNETPFSNPDPVTDPSHYDRSEFIAWKAGEGLRSCLTNLNQRYPGKAFLLAHSMGNVTAGEALALNAEKYNGGQIVNTYVASQAALSLDCYKTNGSDPVYQMPFQYRHPKEDEFAPYLPYWPGLGWLLLYLNGPIINWDSGTPNIYRGWLEPNATSAIRRINCYNPNDYALAMPVWGFNQLLKPDLVSNGTSYRYIKLSSGGTLPRIGGTASVATPFFFIPSPARSGLPQLSGIRQLPGVFRAETFFTGRYLNFEFNLNDMYEAMSFADEARSYPLGKVPDGLGQQVDLRSLWPTDSEIDPDLGAYGRHKWHSGQFRSNNSRQANYWRFLLTDQGFNLQ